ncbi:uncharacterized protein M6B38_157620 [Iris pallida]|uniref:TIR domain-containing protein n=1 Tax=Iris pallida TaxID=29817 RepID=A0AAX6F1K9_IRIPA|nr:uncharacterized protein M6B38_157620 [Iris pallida]
MELQEESSNLGALSTSRRLSSSSSAFVSASQSPFFSPRSPPSHGPDTSSLLVNSLPPGTTTTIIVRQPDVSPAPSFCPSSNFEAAEAFGRDFGCSPYNGVVCSSSNYSQARRERPRRSVRGQGKLSSARPSPSVSSASRLRCCDVYVGFHGRKPSLLRFASWLRAELELQGISCFACDRARCRSSRSHETVERAMDASSFGVVILTRKSFANPYTIEELRHFYGRKNLCPIFFDLGAGDCLTRDIVERRGELWDRHGGELWVHYDGLETEWREAVDGLSRVLDWQLEACEGNWRECVSNAVVLLATRLGRRGVVERVNRWRERVEKEEYPFPRNEDFIGRKKELSELELILFGDVSGDGEREYFELKTRHRRKSLLVGRAKHHRAEESSAKGQQSEGSSKGKEPVLWKESEKEIEMQRVGSPQRKLRPLRSRNSGAGYGRRKRSTKMLYGKGIACISGDSGIGKTELVLEYAYRFSQRYKMVLWVGGEARYIRQNYLNLRNLLELDLGIENHSLEKGKTTRCFEEQEKDSIARVRKELMRDIPFLVVIDNLEGEKDWWDRKDIMDLLPRFGGDTHFIITTRLPRVMNLEPMKLSYLSGMEALTLMKGGVKDYPVAEIDALRVIEEKLSRLTLGLGIVGAILSELPITPSRLLDTVNRMPLRGPAWDDREVVSLQKHAFLIQLLDVCLSIFDHADGPRSLATRMVQVSGWFAPAPVPIPLLALAAHKVPKKQCRPPAWGKCLDAIACSFFSSSHTRRSEAEASSMLTRFGIARHSMRPDCVHFHEIVRAYARKRGATRVAQSMVQAVCLRGSASQHLEHSWAACFLLFGFGNDPVVVEPSPSELLLLVKRVVLPLAVLTFVSFSRCNAALELLRLCTDALELAGESMVSRAEKWTGRSSFCCLRPGRSDAQYTYLWQELALLRATVLETRAKLMLRGGRYDVGDDLIRKAIFIKSSICGEHHPDVVSVRETLSKITRLLTSVQSN